MRLICETIGDESYYYRYAEVKVDKDDAGEFLKLRETVVTLQQKYPGEFRAFQLRDWTPTFFGTLKDREIEPGRWYAADESDQLSDKTAADACLLCVTEDGIYWQANNKYSSRPVTFETEVLTWTILEDISKGIYPFIEEKNHGKEN